MRLSGSNGVLALDQTARVNPRGNVPEPDVTLKWAEKRNSSSDEHRDARNYEAIDETGFEKALDRDAAIDVNMVEVPRRKRGDDLCRGP
jgi:hypothetical protein